MARGNAQRQPSGAQPTTAAERRARTAFREAQARWSEALQAHRLAPPDAGFSARLTQLSAAAQAEADACRQASTTGFEWPPHRASASRPPYELLPDSGRRGPDELWARFDVAVDQLNRAAAGTELVRVADAYAELAEVAGELAYAVAREDRASRPRHRRAQDAA